MTLTYPYSTVHIQNSIQYRLTVSKSVTNKYEVKYERVDGESPDYVTVDGTQYTIGNLDIDPIQNKDLVYIKSDSTMMIGNMEALTFYEDMTKVVILRDQSEYDSVTDTFKKNYYDIVISGSNSSLVKRTGQVTESGGNQYVGLKKIYDFAVDQIQIIQISDADKFRPDGYTFISKNGEIYKYKEVVSSGEPKVYIYYEEVFSVNDPTLNLTCYITKESITENTSTTVKKTYVWNDGYIYHLRSFRDADGPYELYMQKYNLINSNMVADGPEVKINESTTDPFLSLILANNNNGILNVDISYQDFSRIILKKIMTVDPQNPDSPTANAVYNYYLVDASGQISEQLTQEQVNALQIKNGIAIDGRQIVEYFSSETHSSIIVINMATIITSAVDSEGDEICVDILDYVDKISEYNLTNVGRLGDYQNLITKINDYTNAVRDNQVDLSVEQVSILEGYGNYMNQMSNIFGQLIASIETTSLIDASDLQLRIKLALKAIYEGLKKVQKFKIAITDSRIIGIPECILEMSTTLEKINGKLTDYENMITYFLSADGDFQPNDPIAIQFGLTQADKDAIAAAEALVTKYKDDLLQDAASIKNHESIVALKNTLASFESKKQKLMELNNRLLYTLGSSGVVIKSIVNQTTTYSSTTTGRGSVSRNGTR